MKRLLLVLCLLLCLRPSAQAAIAFVNVGVGTADISATTIAAAATSHTAGNLLVVGIAWSGSAITVSSIANTAGDTFVQVSGALNTSNANERTDLWYVSSAIGNASDTVTVTFSAGATLRRVIVAQYSGTDTSTPLDVAATGYTAAGTSVTTANLVTTVANEVIVAFEASGSATTPTAGASFTLRNGANTRYQLEDRIVASTSTYTASMTGTVNTTMVMSAATFKQAGGAAAVVPTLTLLGVGP